MKAKQLRGILMQATHAWINNGKFKGSDTGGEPLILKVAEGTDKKLFVEVHSGHAANTDMDLYEVQIRVRRVK